MKGEDLTVLEQTTQVFVLEATLTISLKKITSEVKFAERRSALPQNSTLFSYKVTPPLHHQEKNFMSK